MQASAARFLRPSRLRSSLSHPHSWKTLSPYICRRTFGDQAQQAIFDFAPDSATRLLTDEERFFKDQFHQFAQKFVAPLASSAETNNSFPNELWPQFGENGLLGITAPEEYGGLGQGYLLHVMATEEISRASGAIGLSYGAHSNLCVNQLSKRGNKQQKDKYLNKLITGEYIGALAMSEITAGLSLSLRALP